MLVHEKLQKVGEGQLRKYALDLIASLDKKASPEIITGLLASMIESGMLSYPYEFSFHIIPRLHFMVAYHNSLCTKCGVRVPKISGLTLTNHGCLCAKCLTEIG